MDRVPNTQHREQTATASGIPVLQFEILDSTNDEALRQLSAQGPAPIWIVADHQNKGRGRSGRIWHSPPGNLYASHLFATAAHPATATQLSFVGALATYDAVGSLLSKDRGTGLRLKWPNDVMLDGAKVAGVLLESLRPPDGKNLAIILGIGINLSAMPPETGRPVGTLGLDPTAVSAAFKSLAAHTEYWIEVWDEGKGFPVIRQTWLDRAFALGEAISVSLNDASIYGRFLGVDSNGALQIETELGAVMTVTAGDVFSDGMR